MGKPVTENVKYAELREIRMNLKLMLKVVDLRTLVAGVFPVLLGSLYSLYAYQKFQLGFLIALVVAIALVQASTNIFNDYMDFRRGTDGSEKSDEKILVSGELKPVHMLLLIALFLSVASIIGLLIAVKTSAFILLVAVAGVLVAFFYSSGPKPISQTPFGEVASGITMGFGITSTVVFIQAGQFQWQCIWMAIPTTIFIAYVMFTNNLCDREKDISAGRHTLPGMFGFETSQKIWLFACALLVLVTLLLIGLKIYPSWNALVLLLLMNYRTIIPMKQLGQREFQKGIMMGVIGKIGIQFHLLMVAGLFIAWYLR